eukprot:TRINITY_DN63731_c0_g1_i1.p1 TRINITY_DN63731_c0_g1~~TRINITY_DN63731_c0_g1_i1.p1  ORF type:complete len:398 (-),score=33.45 TRINITY_DN63731_c0_g1_i1:1129-2322(-)
MTPVELSPKQDATNTAARASTDETGEWTNATQYEQRFNASELEDEVGANNTSETTKVNKTGVALVYYAYTPEIMISHWNLKQWAEKFDVKIGYLPGDRLSRSEKKRYHVTKIDFEDPNWTLNWLGRGSLAHSAATVRKHASVNAHVFTICPYSAEWMNSIVGARVRTGVYYPVNPGLAPAKYNSKKRDLDVIYVGTLNPPISQALTWCHQAALNYTYMKFGNVAKSIRGKFKVTKRLSLRQKIGMYCHTKIAIVHNTLYDKNPGVPRKWPILANHTAFSNFFDVNASSHNNARFGSLFMYPQLKSRTFEAAMCGCVMLVMHDTHNVIERYFTPGVHFLYWYDLDDFKAKVVDVLAHYDKYQHLGIAAQKHTMDKYTVEQFMKDFVAPVAGALKAGTL